MSIRRGEDWGKISPLPAKIETARTDRELANFFSRGDHDVFLRGGDMARTVGAAHVSQDIAQSTALCLPIDTMLVHFSQHGVEHTQNAVSHCVLRRIGYLGGWLIGSVAIVMNAQFLGKWDVAPRGHPNDGRFEVLQMISSMSIRQRLVAHSRVALGQHLPHPDITYKSVSTYLHGDSSSHLWLDGQHLGQVTKVSISVVESGLNVWV